MIVDKDRNSDREKEGKESQGWEGGLEGAYYDFYQNSIRYGTDTVESPKSRREH